MTAVWLPPLPFICCSPFYTYAYKFLSIWKWIMECLLACLRLCVRNIKQIEREPIQKQRRKANQNQSVCACEYVFLFGIRILDDIFINEPIQMNVYANVAIPLPNKMFICLDFILFCLTFFLVRDFLRLLWCCCRFLVVARSSFCVSSFLFTSNF